MQKRIASEKNRYLYSDKDHQMNNGLRILFVRPSKAPFIERDLEILMKNYETKTCDIFERGRGIYNSVKAFLRLAKGVIWCDIAYCWFADIYTLWAVRLCRLLGKKSIVVVGGYETAYLPDFNYGLMKNEKTRKMVRRIFYLADKLLPVSEFIKNEMLEYATADKIEVVHLAIDFSRLPQVSNKENIVVTIGGVTEEKYRLKGIDTFVKCAERIKGARFVVVGETDRKTLDKLKMFSQRVEFIGSIPHDEVLKLLSKTKVYCQLSIRESFGMALLEAAALNCEIIATRTGAIPEILGDYAHYVPYGDVNATCDMIERCLTSYAKSDIQNIVRDRFSVERRESALGRIIDSLIQHMNHDNKLIATNKG